MNDAAHTTVKLVLLRIVTVLASVVVALCAAIYASAAFDFEVSPGFHEGTLISAIVFVSVFIPLSYFSLRLELGFSIASMEILRIQIEDPEWKVKHEEFGQLAS